MTQVQQSPDQIAKGIILILASVTAMAFGDALVKGLSANLSVWQIFFARSAFALPLLFVFARVNRSSLKPRNFGWVLARSALLVLTWIAFYAALPVLTLSVAAVAIYTNPIITALLTAAVLGERVSTRQWLGVAIGFAGVFVVLRPGTDAFSWVVLLPLLAALFYSLAMVLTRSKCQSENAVTLAVGLHSAFLVTGPVVLGVLFLLNLDPDLKGLYPFLLGGWSQMTWTIWALMAVLGFLSAAFFVGVARAYQIAPPQIIATFDYGYLISAAFWGFLFFSETPDGLTVLGMVLITAAGLLVASRR